MSKVKLLYQLKGLQKISPMYSADFIVDSSDTFRVEPGGSVETELSDGKHMLHVGIPFRGNESGAVSVSFEAKQNADYEIIYSMTDFTNAGVITVREIQEGSSSDTAPAEIQVKKGRPNHTAWLLTAFIIISIIIACISIFARRIS